MRWESYGQRILYSHDVLFIDFLTEQRTINVTCYWKLLKDRVKPAFRSKRRGRSVNSVCLLHDNASPHTAAVTTGTMEEMHWEIFNLFSSIKGALGGKRFRADDEVKLFVQPWLNENHKLFFWNGRNEAARAIVPLYGGARRTCGKINFIIWKRNLWIIIIIKNSGLYPDMDGSCEYTEKTVANNLQFVVLQLGGWAWC